MELISVIALGILGLIGAALSKLMADEYKAWLPTVLNHLIGWAISLLPEDKRERYAEEWQSHIDETPGELGKLIVGFGLLLSAQKLSRISPEPARQVQEIVAARKTRGRWGENTLKNVLELTGLNAYSDFATEQSYNQAGVRSRPDVVIRLPGGRSIVVDAKTSMAAYLDAVESADDEARERHLAVHAQQLRSQVKLLAGKSHWDGLTDTPDFVLMFVPGHAFYAAAAERDPELFEFAAKQRVLIVVPETLIALARAVADWWRQVPADTASFAAHTSNTC